MIAAKRHIIGFLMTAIYLLITLSPLAPLAMHSKRIAHAVTGECSGDCRVCGCSAERSANHTCCCWQKRLRQHAHEDHDSCESEHHTKVASCCSAGKNAGSEHHDDTATANNKPATKGTPIVITCCPCGSGKHLAFGGTEKTQHLPFRFSNAIPLPQESNLIPEPLGNLTSCHNDPPDPPPKLILHA